MHKSFSSMAAITFFTLLATFHTGSAQQRQLSISLGSSLIPTRDSSWLSPGGIFAFGFYKQDNGYAVGVFIAGIPEKTVVWTANRDNPVVPSNSTLLLTTDGLVVQGVQGQDISIAGPSESIAAASMLDSGNFVLYNSNQKIIWQSFDNATDTMLPGQRLSAGQELIASASENDSSKGIFRLKMNTDANLLLFPVDTSDAPSYAYWASDTTGMGSNVSLNLNDDGYLYLFNSSMVIKNFTNGGYPKNRTLYLAKLDVEGIFRLYSRSLDQVNWSMKWESSGDKCSPKGVCGLNSLCTPQDTEFDCKCFPGFDFLIQGNKRSGCVRNFTEICKSSLKYEIITWDNAVWEDQSYATLKTTAKEGCEEACQEDCNCEVAFFKDGDCKKQRLPLRFGRRLVSDSNIALIKVGIPESVTSIIPGDHKETGKKELRLDILIISISLLGGAILILGITGVLIHRNRVWSYKKISGKRNVEFLDYVAPRAFTYAELLEATDDFKEEIGRGAFGTVYKGILPDCQKTVAVKRLDKILAEGEKEFQNEIRTIGKTHHRNLVHLLGFCIDGAKRLLVYEYMSNGSLANILFNPENSPNWEERIGIAFDIARGIVYLHEECETQIIHCDIKPQNTLLDQQLRAKISDFGLAKLLNHDQTRTYTGVRGTRGYAAPEWHRRSPVTVKVDVYSFGIVLLEIICCRKTVDWSLPEHEAILEEWAYTCFMAGELQKLVGEEEVDKNSLERMIKIAIWCIQDEPSLRPSMKKVLQMLEGTVDIPIPPSPTSFLSTA